MLAINQIGGVKGNNELIEKSMELKIKKSLKSEKLSKWEKLSKSKKLKSKKKASHA